MPTLQIADKPTLDAVNSKIDTLDTVADNIYAKVDTEVAAIKTKTDLIGATGDTGGSTSAGTIFGKLNAILSSSSGGSGSANVGSTGDTGGSTTAGTVMAKLNALLTSWTSTRAGYVDNIRSYTITNNTENKTGVLSQKLSYLINRANKVVTPSSTNLKQLSSSGTVTVPYVNQTSGAKTVSSNWTGYGYVQVPGIYRFSTTFSVAITQDGGDGTNTGTLEVQVVSCNTGSTYSKTATIFSSSAAVGSTTKTLDIPLGVGDMVRCRITCKNGPYYIECGGYAYGDAFTLTWTDISVRGTLTEITTNAVR